MCQLLKNLKLSDWLDILQMLIAFGSAILLYLTFRKQGENDKRAIELAEMEKKAKRAEFLPKFVPSVNLDGPLDTIAIDQANKYNYIITEFQKLDLSEDQNTNIKLILFVEDGSMIINSLNTRWKAKSSNKVLDYEMFISHASIGKSYLYTRGNEFEINYSINFLELTKSKSNGSSFALNNLIKDYLKTLYMEVIINIEDLIGNVYELNLRLHKLESLTVHELKIIEKTSD